MSEQWEKGKREGKGSRLKGSNGRDGKEQRGNERRNRE